MNVEQLKVTYPKKGSAGFEQPQDCKVFVTLMSEGDLSIHLHSKYQQMFGKQITKCIECKLKELGVEHAIVEIYDYGSLDFTIRARIKTAVNRAQLSTGDIAENMKEGETLE